MSLKSLSFSPLHYHRTVSPVFGFLHMFPLSLINKGRCNCTKRLHTTFAFVIDSLLATYNRWILLFLRFALQQSTISSSSSTTTSHTKHGTNLFSILVPSLLFAQVHRILFHIFNGTIEEYGRKSSTSEWEISGESHATEITRISIRIPGTYIVQLAGGVTKAWSPLGWWVGRSSAKEASSAVSFKPGTLNLVIINTAIIDNPIIADNFMFNIVSFNGGIWRCWLWKGWECLARRRRKRSV